MPARYTGRKRYEAPAPSGDQTGAVDSTVIQGLIDAAAAAGGGLVQLQPTGTTNPYWAHNIKIKTSVVLAGAGIDATTIKAPASSSNDVITVEDFGTLTGSNEANNCPRNFTLRDFTVDGNRANKSSGWPVRVYAFHYFVENLRIREGKSGGFYSEHSTIQPTTVDMQCHFFGLDINGCNSTGLDWNGPHDSHFTDVVVTKTGTVSADHSNAPPGIWIRGNAGGDKFVNCHVWSDPFDTQGPAYRCDKQTFFTNCYAESGNPSQVVFAADGCAWAGGTIRANNAAGPGGDWYGFQIGDSARGFTNVKRCSITGATSIDQTRAMLYFESSGGANYAQVTDTGAGSFAYAGTPHKTDTILVQSTSNQYNIERSMKQVRWVSPDAPAGAEAWTLYGTDDSTLKFKMDATSSPHVFQISNGGEIRTLSGTSGYTARLTGSGFLELGEITAPSAPSANYAKLFVQDNGSGKTQLCVRFPTGAVQVIATEP